MKLINNVGLILLAVYLILVGLMAIVPSVVIPAVVMGVIAIASGVLILIGR